MLKPNRCTDPSILNACSTLPKKYWETLRVFTFARGGVIFQRYMWFFFVALKSLKTSILWTENMICFDQCKSMVIFAWANNLDNWLQIRCRGIILYVGVMQLSYVSVLYFLSYATASWITWIAHVFCVCVCRIFTQLSASTSVREGGSASPDSADVVAGMFRGFKSASARSLALHEVKRSIGLKMLPQVALLQPLLAQKIASKQKIQHTKA